MGRFMKGNLINIQYYLRYGSSESTSDVIVTYHRFDK